MNKTLNEQISLFADGELEGGHHEMILKALREPAGRAAWDACHHVGDAIRSADMAADLSPDFAARMAARLDAEPAYIALRKYPQAAAVAPPILAASAGSRHQGWRRFGIPGAAIAATVVLAVAAGPRLGGGSHGSPFGMTGQVRSGSLAAAGEGSAPAVARDARIDTYLLAHQRFSPSLYSTAQYARSYTFATDSSK